MPESLWNYYGVDWIAMLTSLLFLYLIGNKKRISFVFGFLASICWIFVNYIADIFPGILLNIVMLFMHIRGFWKWKPRTKKQ